MFMLTIQKGGLKRVGALALCGAVLAGAALAGRLVRGGAHRAVTASATISSTQDIQTYFLGFGLEVDPTDITADKVKVPRRWDDSFAAFNTIVSQSGRDLSTCKGKTVEKWLAAIPALQQDGQTVYGVLLVRRQQVVGAYLLAKPSGQVSGLSDVVQTLALEQAGEAAAPAPAAPADPAGAEAQTAAEPGPELLVETEGYPVE